MSQNFKIPRDQIPHFWTVLGEPMRSEPLATVEEVGRFLEISEERGISATDSGDIYQAISTYYERLTAQRDRPYGESGIGPIASARLPSPTRLTNPGVLKILKTPVSSSNDKKYQGVLALLDYNGVLVVYWKKLGQNDAQSRNLIFIPPENRVAVKNIFEFESGVVRPINENQYANLLQEIVALSANPQHALYHRVSGHIILEKELSRIETTPAGLHDLKIQTNDPELFGLLGYGRKIVTGNAVALSGGKPITLASPRVVVVLKSEKDPQVIANSHMYLAVLDFNGFYALAIDSLSGTGSHKKVILCIDPSKKHLVDAWFRERQGKEYTINSAQSLEYLDQFKSVWIKEGHPLYQAAQLIGLNNNFSEVDFTREGLSRVQVRGPQALMEGLGYYAAEMERLPLAIDASPYEHLKTLPVLNNPVIKKHFIATGVEGDAHILIFEFSNVYVAVSYLPGGKGSIWLIDAKYREEIDRELQKTTERDVNITPLQLAQFNIKVMGWKMGAGHQLERYVRGYQLPATYSHYAPELDFTKLSLTNPDNLDEINAMERLLGGTGGGALGALTDRQRRIQKQLAEALSDPEATGDPTRRKQRVVSEPVAIKRVDGEGLAKAVDVFNKRRDEQRDALRSFAVLFMNTLLGRELTLTNDRLSLSLIIPIPEGNIAETLATVHRPTTLNDIRWRDLMRKEMVTGMTAQFKWGESDEIEFSLGKDANRILIFRSSALNQPVGASLVKVSDGVYELRMDDAYLNWIDTQILGPSVSIKLNRVQGKIASLEISGSNDKVLGLFRKIKKHIDAAVNELEDSQNGTWTITIAYQTGHEYRLEKLVEAIQGIYEESLNQPRTVQYTKPAPVGAPLAAPSLPAPKFVEREVINIYGLLDKAKGSVTGNQIRVVGYNKRKARDGSTIETVIEKVTVAGVEFKKDSKNLIVNGNIVAVKFEKDGIFYDVTGTLDFENDALAVNATLTPLAQLTQIISLPSNFESDAGYASDIFNITLSVLNNPITGQKEIRHILVALQDGVFPAEWNIPSSVDLAVKQPLGDTIKITYPEIGELEWSLALPASGGMETSYFIVRKPLDVVWELMTDDESISLMGLAGERDVLVNLQTLSRSERLRLGYEEGWYAVEGDDLTELKAWYALLGLAFVDNGVNKVVINMRGNHIEAMSEFDDNIILPKYISHKEMDAIKRAMLGPMRYGATMDFTVTLPVQEPENTELPESIAMPGDVYLFDTQTHVLVKGIVDEIRANPAHAVRPRKMDEPLRLVNSKGRVLELFADLETRGGIHFEINRAKPIVSYLASNPEGTREDVSKMIWGGRSRERIELAELKRFGDSRVIPWKLEEVRHPQNALFFGLADTVDEEGSFDHRDRYLASADKALSTHTRQMLQNDDSLLVPIRFVYKEYNFREGVPISLTYTATADSQGIEEVKLSGISIEGFSRRIDFDGVLILEVTCYSRGKKVSQTYQLKANHNADDSFVTLRQIDGPKVFQWNVGENTLIEVDVATVPDLSLVAPAPRRVYHTEVKEKARLVLPEGIPPLKSDDRSYDFPDDEHITKLTDPAEITKAFEEFQAAGERFYTLAYPMEEDAIVQSYKGNSERYLTLVTRSGLIFYFPVKQDKNGDWTAHAKSGEEVFASILMRDVNHPGQWFEMGAGKAKIVVEERGSYQVQIAGMEPINFYLKKVTTEVEATKQKLEGYAIVTKEEFEARKRGLSAYNTDMRLWKHALYLHDKPIATAATDENIVLDNHRTIELRVKKIPDNQYTFDGIEFNAEKTQAYVTYEHGDDMGIMEVYRAADDTPVLYLHDVSSNEWFTVVVGNDGAALVYQRRNNLSDILMPTTDTGITLVGLDGQLYRASDLVVEESTDATVHEIKSVVYRETVDANKKIHDMIFGLDRSGNVNIMQILTGAGTRVDRSRIRYWLNEQGQIEARAIALDERIGSSDKLPWDDNFKIHVYEDTWTDPFTGIKQFGKIKFVFVHEPVKGKGSVDVTPYGWFEFENRQALFGSKADFSVLKAHYSVDHRYVDRKVSGWNTGFLTKQAGLTGEAIPYKYVLSGESRLGEEVTDKVWTLNDLEIVLRVKPDLYEALRSVRARQDDVPILLGALQLMGGIDSEGHYADGNLRSLALLVARDLNGVPEEELLFTASKNTLAPILMEREEVAEPPAPAPEDVPVSVTSDESDSSDRPEEPLSPGMGEPLAHPDVVETSGDEPTVDLSVAKKEAQLKWVGALFGSDGIKVTQKENGYLYELVSGYFGGVSVLITDNISHIHFVAHQNLKTDSVKATWRMEKLARLKIRLDRTGLDKRTYITFLDQDEDEVYWHLFQVTGQVKPYDFITLSPTTPHAFDTSYIMGDAEPEVLLAAPKPTRAPVSSGASSAAVRPVRQPGTTTPLAPGDLRLVADDAQADAAVDEMASYIHFTTNANRLRGIPVLKIELDVALNALGHLPDIAKELETAFNIEAFRSGGLDAGVKHRAYMHYRDNHKQAGPVSFSDFYKYLINVKVPKDVAKNNRKSMLENETLFSFWWHLDENISFNSASISLYGNIARGYRLVLNIALNTFKEGGQFRTSNPTTDQIEILRRKLAIKLLGLLPLIKQMYAETPMQETAAKPKAQSETARGPRGRSADLGAWLGDSGSVAPNERVISSHATSAATPKKPDGDPKAMVVEEGLGVRGLGLAGEGQIIEVDFSQPLVHGALALKPPVIEEAEIVMPSSLVDSAELLVTEDIVSVNNNNYEPTLTVPRTPNPILANPYLAGTGVLGLLANPAVSFTSLPALSSVLMTAR